MNKKDILIWFITPTILLVGLVIYRFLFPTHAYMKKNRKVILSRTSNHKLTIS